uniref:ATP-dependent RNA helicase DDX1 n=1 Tax=Rhabditophanes sp. KR3021 TaxID=114890 RepID=A0AC35TIK7_9BILA
MAAFEDLGVIPELAEAVERIGWNLPTDIQAEGIPAILGGGDVLMAAQTGSGKTGAFCLPVLQIVWETMKYSSNPQPTEPQEEDNSWKINPQDKTSAMEINGSSLHTTNDKIWNGGRCNFGVKWKGQFYYEVFCEAGDLFRVGFGTQSANLNLGMDKGGFGFGATAMKSNNKVFEGYGEKFGAGDYIGCYIDLEKKEIFFSKNGITFPTAFKIPPNLCKEIFCPMIAMKNAKCVVNFGQTPFKHMPSSDFKAICASATGESKRTIASMGGPTEKRGAKSPLCIIVESSKELALQTHDQLTKFSTFLEEPTVKNTLVSGALSTKEQEKMLLQGSDIMTCTPGRLIDLVEHGKIDLRFVKFFVLDEADALVSGTQNHWGILKKLYGKMIKSESVALRLQVIVCSATLHNPMIDKLAREMMSFPQWVDLKGQDSVPDSVHHVVVMVDPVEDKAWIRLRTGRGGLNVLTDRIHAKDQIKAGSTEPNTLSEGVKILKMEYCAMAIEKMAMTQAIIFCRTKVDCDNLEKFFQRRGEAFNCVVMHGDRSPEERNANLLKFKEKAANFLICTDVAARGLDISGLPYVINMTLPSPEEKANYLHRIGRVGRSEVMGLAISFVSTKPEKVWYHQCQSKGKECTNANLTKDKGCAIWYNEIECLQEVEEHLGETIQLVTTDFQIPKNVFDGRVVYGMKNKQRYSCQNSHAMQLTGVCKKLFELERNVQLSYLDLFINLKTMLQ